MIHDRYISKSVELGFSVKSQLGGDSTLLNAGRTTNFIYKINGINLTDKEVDNINNIDNKSKIRDRVLAIKTLGARLVYSKMESSVFQNNLVLIDSLMPNIISELLLKFNEGISSSIEELTAILLSENTLNFNKNFAHNFYEYKIKRFLTDVALGMIPSKVWRGLNDDAEKHNSKIVCYHIYNKNQFEDYLFHNTKMETASSIRHGFGSVFKEDGELFFKLNLQIRFK